MEQGFIKSQDFQVIVQHIKFVWHAHSTITHSDSLYLSSMLYLFVAVLRQSCRCWVSSNCLVIPMTHCLVVF